MKKRTSEAANILSHSPKRLLSGEAVDNFGTQFKKSARHLDFKRLARKIRKRRITIFNQSMQDFGAR
jgi:hypothetical protein